MSQSFQRLMRKRKNEPMAEDARELLIEEFGNAKVTISVVKGAQSRSVEIRGAH